VARTPDFREFVDDLAMHIAALRPDYVSSDDIPEAVVTKERNIQIARVMEEGKPEHIASRIVDGRIGKWKKEIALMEQFWMHDDSGKVPVREILQRMVVKTGENIQVRRFISFNLGEGMEKKQSNLAEEVAAMTKG
jgi:elongation factor Ts